LSTADLIHSSALTCPGCGYVVQITAHIPNTGGDDDSDTRPVPRELLAAIHAAGSGTPGADALDATTKPAPARLDPTHADAAGDGALTMRTAELPPQLAPRPGDAAPAADAQRHADHALDAHNDAAGDANVGAGSAGPAGNGGRARRPWAALSIVALIVFLLATALAAVFITSPQSSGKTTSARATPTTAPSPTATPASVLPTLTFTKTGLYRLKYPAGWIVNQQNVGGSNVVFSSEQNTGVNPAINVQVIPANESAPDMATRDSDILKASATGNSIHNQTGPTSVVVGGQTWTEMAADVTLTGSTQTVHEVVLSVIHGQNVLSITYFAAPADFASANTAAFQPALASFTFLS